VVRSVLGQGRKEYLGWMEDLKSKSSVRVPKVQGGGKKKRGGGNKKKC